MTRRELREHCFKLLFCIDFYPENERIQQIDRYFQSPDEDGEIEGGEAAILHQVELSESDAGYLRSKAADIVEKVSELDVKINDVAEGWKTRRMGKVELTILRLALFEMGHDDEVPEKVAINEAVELAKKFGGDDSPAFVNGVLAKMVGKN